MPRDAFDIVRELVPEFLQGAEARLLVAQRIPLAGLRRKDIPKAPGVYFFARLGGSPKYVGESDNLQRRIYQNHLMGQLGQSAFKRRVAEELGTTNNEELKDDLRRGFEVAWLPVDLGRKEVEEYISDRFKAGRSNEE